MHVTYIFILFVIASAKRQRKDSMHPRKDKNEEDFNKNKEIDAKPGIYPHPVLFSHVYRDGIGDTDIKQPMDFLDLDMVKPKNSKHALELLQKADIKNIQLLPKKVPMKFLSPRDEMEYYKKFYNSSDAQGKQKTNRPIYDFSAILENNVALPLGYRRSSLESKKKNIVMDKNTIARPENITEHFQENRFYRKPVRPRINWTTCDEFAKNAVFHPNDVVNTKWLPFFIWSTNEYSSSVIHTFTYPDKKIVHHFKTIYGPHMKKLNWREPKLLLKERRQILLIAGDRKGLFYGIPEHDLPTNSLNITFILPTLTMRLKIHDPYLAMMYCDDRYATIMAELGTEPKDEREALQEATTLKFRGRGNPVQRDIEEENLLMKVMKDRKVQAESKKIIRIHVPLGDVDERVNH